MGLVQEYNFKKIEYTNDKETMIKKAQRILNEEIDSEIASRLFKTATKCVMEGQDILPNISQEVINYAKELNNSIGVVSLESIKFQAFIDEIKKEKDFIKAYIIQQDIEKIWIVIEESNFNNNKKYLRKARHFKKENECEFELTIFDKNQIAGMKEELESYQNYRMIN